MKRSQRNKKKLWAGKEEGREKQEVGVGWEGVGEEK